MQPLIQTATARCPKQLGAEDELDAIGIPPSCGRKRARARARCASACARGPCWKRVPIPSRAPHPLNAKLPVAPMQRVLFIPHVYQTLRKRTVTWEWFS